MSETSTTVEFSYDAIEAAYIECCRGEIEPTGIRVNSQMMLRLLGMLDQAGVLCCPPRINSAFLLFDPDVEPNSMRFIVAAQPSLGRILRFCS